MRIALGERVVDRPRRRCNGGARGLCAAASFLFLLAASVAFADATGAITQADVGGPSTWGSVANVMQVRHLYFSAQPDGAALEAAHRAGVEVVINLRAPGEHEWDEKTAVEALGMKYYNVPISGPTFERDAIEAVEAVLAAHAGRPTQIHCASGNRAAGWLAVHLVTKHELAEADAIAIARKAGITHDVIAERVQGYLSALKEAE